VDAFQDDQLTRLELDDIAGLLTTGLEVVVRHAHRFTSHETA
jgi:hypothetical protein